MKKQDLERLKNNRKEELKKDEKVPDVSNSNQEVFNKILELKKLIRVEKMDKQRQEEFEKALKEIAGKLEVISKKEPKVEVNTPDKIKAEVTNFPKFPVMPKFPPFPEFPEQKDVKFPEFQKVLIENQIADSIQIDRNRDGRIISIEYTFDNRTFKQIITYDAKGFISRVDTEEA